jgi:septum formation protein
MWFSRYYSGRMHAVWTGVSVWTKEGILLDQTVMTSVTFRTLTGGDIAWYISTAESLGKAGGYAVQGLASLFISEIHGSLSNVIGLPLEVLRPVLLTDQ